MKQVGVGVVGLNMGKNYALAFQDYEKSELIAVCDYNSEVLDQAVNELGVKGYLSYSDMVKDPEIDAMAIASPSYEHAPMGVLAALNEKHVLVDKPIATDLTAGDRLIQTCKERRVKLAGIFQSRLDPLNIRMKAFVNEGKLGRVFLIEGVVKWWRDDQSYYHKNKEVEMWKGSWFGEGGGSLANQGIHTVDQLYWMMGEVDTVYGQYATVGHTIQAEDFCTALVKFKNDVIGYLICTTSAPKDMQETRVSVYGVKGVVSRVGDNLKWSINDETTEAFIDKELKSDTLSTPRGGPHDLICHDFVDSIIEDRNPQVTGESALKALEIVTGVYQSAVQGQPVKFPLPRY